MGWFLVFGNESFKYTSLLLGEAALCTTACALPRSSEMKVLLALNSGCAYLACEIFLSALSGLVLRLDTFPSLQCVLLVETSGSLKGRFVAFCACTISAGFQSIVNILCAAVEANNGGFCRPRTMSGLTCRNKFQGSDLK